MVLESYSSWLMSLLLDGLVDAYERRTWPVRPTDRMVANCVLEFLTESD